MNRTEIEPGLIQVFRWYAILRAVLAAFLPFIGMRHNVRLGFEPSGDIIFPAVFTAVEVTLLIIYLYWTELQNKLGRYYLPIAITIATAGLIIEQQIISPGQMYWQPLPFLYILVIFVAWQYSFRDVILYTIGAALFEIALVVINPEPSLTQLLPPEIGRAATFGMLIFRSLTFLLIGYVVSRLMRAQRKQRQELAEANRKLVRHAAALEQLTISRERNRMARELHDTLAHTLSALVVQIDALFAVWEPIPDKARMMLEQILDTTRSGLDETRRALGALRASPIEEMGLALAVRSLAEDLADRSALELELDIHEDWDELPPEVEQTYYRVTQEALENIAKHADANKITLTLSGNTDDLNLTIRDDGRGFTPKEISEKRQLGLLGMQERAELIDALLTIDGQTGKGTIVRLKMSGKR